jgi:nucleoside-diphosphate kinase
MGRKSRTLVIIKKDAIERNLIGEIIKRIEENKMKIKDIKMLKMKKSIAKKFYSHIYKNKKFIFNNLMNFMCSSPLIFMIVEGENAAVRMKKLAGATDPSKAEKGTIRGDLGIDSMEKADKEKRCVYNLIHVSDPDKAEKEIKIFFQK